VLRESPLPPRIRAATTGISPGPRQSLLHNELLSKQKHRYLLKALLRSSSSRRSVLFHQKLANPCTFELLTNPQTSGEKSSVSAHRAHEVHHNSSVSIPSVAPILLKFQQPELLNQLREHPALPIRQSERGRRKIQTPKFAAFVPERV
jgi:hypothetical protein